MAFICDVVLFGVFSDKTVSLRTFHQGQITSFVRKTERLSRQPVPGVVVQSGSYVLFRVWNLVKGLQSQKTKNITDVKIKALELKLVPHSAFKCDTHPKICTQIYFSILLASVRMSTAFAFRQVSIFLAFLLR